MRYLGIDYGTKRVGVALTDETGTMAFPHAVYPNDDALQACILELIDTYSVAAVIIGHSLDGNFAPNVVQSEVEAFMSDLTLACPIPIHLQPEQYTTQAALRLQGRTTQTDASAAALILDSYLQTLS